MTVALSKNIFLVVLLTFITAAYAGGPGRRCENPRVRREWRSISETERAEWLTAVKVGSRDPK